MGDDSKVGQLDSLAYATVDTARPTTPAAGANFDWGSVGNWTKLEPYVDEDDISVAIREEVLAVDPPDAQHTLRDIILKYGLEGFTVAIYETGANAFKHVSNATQVGNKTTYGTTLVYKAWCMAFNGVGMIYMPKVKIGLGGLVTGKKKLTVPSLLFEPRESNSVTGGFEYYEFDGT